MRDGDVDNIFEVQRGPGASGEGGSGEGGCLSRRARDLSRVRELSEWMRDDAYSKVLVGRVFVTLGVKFAEMAAMVVGMLWRMRASYRDATNCLLAGLA